MNTKSFFKMHKVSFFLLALTLVICVSIFLSPVFSSSTNPCSSCHGGYSQYLDILEGNSGNNIPTTLTVGQTSTVTVVIENRVSTASYTGLSSVSLTLTSQNSHFTVAAPTYNVGTLPKGTKTVTWQITATSAGPDALVITASGRNSHQSLSFSDHYLPNPSITILALPPPPPPSTYTVTMQLSPNGTTAPAPGIYNYSSGSSATFTATPNAGYKFDYWAVNGGTDATNPLTRTITSDVVVTPVFTLIPPQPPSTYTVTVQLSPNGTTTPSAGIYNYTTGSSVSYTATPNSGYRFDYWAVDGVSNTTNPMVSVVTSDVVITPVFTLLPPPPSPPPAYIVTILSSPNGTTTPTPGTYNHTSGSSVPLTATPNTGYRFDYWLVNGVANITNPMTKIITSNLAINPIFTLQSQPPPPTPTTYTVTVQSSPNGTTTPTSGTYNYTSGSLLTLTATPKTGYRFDYWAVDGVSNTTNPIVLTVDSNLAITTVFTLPPPITYTVIMQLSPSGTTVPAPGIYSYTSGSSVMFAAVPNAGYNFNGWAVNGATNTTNPITLTANSNLAITPVFTLPPPPPATYTVTVQLSPNGTTVPAPGILVYTSGSSVMFAAVPNAGYNFDYWLVNGVTNRTNPATIAIDSNLEMSPVFTQKVESAPTPTSFTVTLQSSVNGTTTPPLGIYSRTAGDTLALAATPNTNYRFDYWLINGAANVTNPLTLEVTSDAIVLPMFSLVINTPIESASTIQENQTATTPLAKNLTIIILSPTSGEKWQAGTIHTIAWNISGGTEPLRITLEYALSSSSGTWITIAKDLPNNGSLAWRVPNDLTACSIRARVTDSAGTQQNATAQMIIENTKENNKTTNEIQGFLTATMLLPLLAIAAIFLKLENTNIKSTTIPTKSSVSNKASDELTTK